MDKFQKGFGMVLMILMGVLAAGMFYKSAKIVTANGLERGKEILSAAYEQVADCAVACYLPQVLYDEEGGKRGDFIDRIVEQAREQIPGLSLEKEQKEAAEIIEDDSTEEAILEENERMLLAKSQQENQDKVQQAKVQPTTTVTPAAPPEAQAAQAAVNSAPTIVNPISVDQLQNYDYLLNHFFVVDGNTTAQESQINVDELWGKDLTMAKDAAKPQILIYHTHSQEEFADSVEGDTSTSVIGVGDYLDQLLTETYGYNVMHLTNTFDLVDGNLERSKAYNYAEPVVQQTLDENPSIEVVIDLHRDGVDESKRLVTEVDGRPTAKIMFFNGLSRTTMNGEIDSLPNPYIEDNLAFSFQLEYLAKQSYPDFTRCVYLKGYRYNLHVRPKSILLEVGAQTNTVEEAMNAMIPFAKVLNAVLQGTNKNP